jgi:hypothetical protein
LKTVVVPLKTHATLSESLPRTFKGHSNWEFNFGSVSYMSTIGHLSDVNSWHSDSAAAETVVDVEELRIRYQGEFLLLLTEKLLNAILTCILPPDIRSRLSDSSWQCGEW